MRRMGRTVRTAIVALMTVATVVGCSSGGDAADVEDESRMTAYERMVDNDPALVIDDPRSPTRKTINRWKALWLAGDSQLVYVYMMAANGQLVGYYILDAPPVSMCATINRPYTWEDIPGDGGSTRTMVPAPADDGVYYSGSQCMVHYGFEAVTGAYREFTVGGSLNYTLSNQPLPHPEVEPIGISIEEVEAAQDD